LFHWGVCCRLILRSDAQHRVSKDATEEPEATPSGSAGAR
jgi:hypothetical protein